MRSPISQSAKITGMNLSSRPPLMKWGIVLGLAAIYLLAFGPSERAFGPSVTTFVVIPVIAAAWYFGLPGGLVASLFGISFSLGMLLRTTDVTLDELIRLGLIFRSAMLIALVFVIHIAHSRIEKFMLAEANARSREEYLALLNDMTRAILLSRDIDSTLTTLAGRIAKLIDANECYITRWDNTKQPPMSAEGIAILAELDLFRDDRTLAVNDLLDAPHIDREKAGLHAVRALLGVP